MILLVAALLKDICAKGRDYLWPRPEVCPCCKIGRPWGHGFVLAYFDGFTSGVLLRRYRCSECGTVMRLKPQGYFQRFQASIESIRSIISDLVEKAQRCVLVSRTRQAHWIKALKKKTLAYFGSDFRHNLLAAFDQLVGMGRIAVSRSIQSRMKPGFY